MSKIYIETLGCPKNWVDSEHLLGQIDQSYLTSNPEKAECIIVNTCSFILDSRQESIETILELAQYKMTGQCKKLIVTGCLVQSNEEELRSELKEVDFFYPMMSPIQLRDILNLDQFNNGHYERFLLKKDGSNYLKIADGCNHFCTFCTIPQFKGKYKSVSRSKLVEEARFLATNGLGEINLVAQDTTSYGTDLDQENITLLLQDLVKIKEIKWIRLLYLYPTLISDELIKIIKNEEKICNYFDIPLQHLNDTILKLMKRFGTVSEYYELIQKIREEIKEVAIRTALIVGFPGETDDIFQSMVQQVEKFQFNHLGVFEYSLEETTKSYQLEHHINKEVKKSRYKTLMELQAKISSKLLESRVGKVYDTLIEEPVEGEDDNLNYYIGRSEFEAPDVDGNIVIGTSDKLRVGEWFSVEIMSSSQYDLFGKVV